MRTIPEPPWAPGDVLPPPPPPAPDPLLASADFPVPATPPRYPPFPAPAYGVLRLGPPPPTPSGPGEVS